MGVDFFVSPKSFWLLCIFIVMGCQWYHLSSCAKGGLRKPVKGGGALWSLSDVWKCYRGSEILEVYLLCHQDSWGSCFCLDGLVILRHYVGTSSTIPGLFWIFIRMWPDISGCLGCCVWSVAAGLLLWVLQIPLLQQQLIPARYPC